MPALVDPLLTPGVLAGAPQPTINAAGLGLRPWREDDLSAVVEAYLDPEIQQWHRRSVDEREAAVLINYWINVWARETDACWAIVQGTEDRAVGYVGLHRIDLENGSAQIAYWVTPLARGHHLGARATRLLSDWALRVVGLHRIELHHALANDASCHVANAAGFELEGTAVRSLRHRDGWHDMHVHSRVTSEPAEAPVP